jgi:hypothetical protein
MDESPRRKFMMRIRHVGTTPLKRPTSRVFDEHVFLTIEVDPDRPGSPPLYWNVVDPKWNLIEVGIDRSSGELVSIILTFYRGALASMNMDRLPEPPDKEIGIPKFDLKMWNEPKDLYDIRSEIEEFPARCHLQLLNKTLRIEISPETVAYLVEVSETLVAEFNHNNELIGVVMRSLTTQEVRKVERYVTLHAHNPSA